jgi:hypothetical protein
VNLTFCSSTLSLAFDRHFKRINISVTSQQLVYSFLDCLLNGSGFKAKYNASIAGIKKYG